MRRTLLFLVWNLLISQAAFSQLSPLITSWHINTTDIGFADGLTNVQQVNYSSNYVYVKTEDIPSWIPIEYDWPNNPWFAVPMNYQFRFRLNPTPNAGPETNTGYGHIGLWKNGCSIYNPKDAKSYQDSSVWFQNAWFWEHLIAETFDSCIGHPNGSGEYHTHVSPACLYDITDSTQVSPLIGYAFDSYPIYGGYGYSDPLDTTSAVIRLKSSYRLREITDRTTLPDGTILDAIYYGPPIDTNTTSLDPLDDSPVAAPLGAYMEDYEYVPGLGDLDEHNGRFCITRDYPNGIYAYFTTIDWVADHYDTSIKPVFPYVLGTAYYGEVYPADGNTGPGSGFVVISEPVTPYYGAATPVSVVLSPLSISIYPNPTSSSLNIDTRGIEETEILQCVIFDSKGALVNEITLQSNVVNTIDGQHLLDGVYLIRIQTASQSKNFKLIVNK
jgi:hypothetical protein